MMSRHDATVGSALVTAIGSFSAPAAITSLRSLGYSVVGCDIYPAEWVANSLDVDAFYQVPLASETDAYLAALRDIVERERVDVILPSTDFEVDALTGRRDRVGATVCMSSDETLRKCRSKVETYRVLREGVGEQNLILTYLLDEVDLEKVTYPAVCKPVDGRSSSGLLFVGSADEARSRVPSEDWGRYCIQPKTPGHVVTVDILRHDGVTFSMPRRELLRTLNGAGTSVEVFEDAGLEALCSRIAGLLGVEGCVNFEFLEQGDGTYRFLECNPRLSGGVAFSVMSGYDFISNHVRHFTGAPVEMDFRIMPQLIARRYVECVTGRREA